MRNRRIVALRREHFRSYRRLGPLYDRGIATLPSSSETQEAYETANRAIVEQAQPSAC